MNVYIVLLRCVKQTAVMPDAYRLRPHGDADLRVLLNTPRNSCRTMLGFQFFKRKYAKFDDGSKTRV